MPVSLCCCLYLGSPETMAIIQGMSRNKENPENKNGKENGKIRFCRKRAPQSIELFSHTKREKIDTLPPP